MKKIFFTTILVCYTFSVFSQTAKETKEFIETKFNELNLITDSTIIFNSNNWSTYHIQNLLYFRSKFIVLMKITQHTTYGGNIPSMQSNKFTDEDFFIDISKLSTVSFKKVNNKCVVTFISNNPTSNYKFMTKETNKSTFGSYGDFLQTDLKLINKKFSNNIYPFEISFYTNTYDEEIIRKLKKAFKHLVGLNGGKIIDDLF
jgi:hypothetical protein